MLVFLLASGIVALFGAFAKEVIVPGASYRRVLSELEIWQQQGDRNAKALEAILERAKATERRENRARERDRNGAAGAK